MERTYHRRRSSIHAGINNTTETTPALARQALQIAEDTGCTNQSQDDQSTRGFEQTSMSKVLCWPPTEKHGQIEVGSVYEIDHSNLPPRTPVQLRSIRIVMVCEKTDLNIAVRFPSIQSLQRYFSSENQEKYPEFDDRFLMGTQLAVKVLIRRIPALELSLKKKLDDFWLVISSSLCRFGGGAVPNKVGKCFSELNGNGMVRWGVRRQVKFIGRHREPNPQSSSSIVRASREETNCEGIGEDDQHEGEEEEEEKDEEEEEDEKEEEEGEDEEVEEDTKEANTEESCESQQSGGKRKRYSSRLVGKVQKLNSGEKKKKQVAKPKPKNTCRKMVLLKNPQDRWSTERYKQAEQNLLEVMKAKGAVYGKPILRPELRAEARKFIGDTGLLDHLLKHMAGKVAPGSNERFRRRHNAEGAMEYWLESADLVDIRREAGIEDPYWTPAPGWVPGDSVTMDPNSAKELQNYLKAETIKLRREMENMVSRKEMEEELAKLRKEMNELLSKLQQDPGAIVASDPSLAKEQQMAIDVSSAPSNSGLQSSLVTVEKDKEQQKDVSKGCSGIEEEMGKVKSKEKEERSRSEPALMVATESCEKEKKKAESEVVKKQEEGKEERKTAAEQKAAKIERLKSGFRICKPQGTFLWPNMVHSNNNNSMSSSQVVVQVEDFLMAPTPTPPSVSSSTASTPPQLPFYHHHHPASPVKPMPERRAVTVTVSAVGDGGNFSTTTTTTTTASNNNKTTTCINLNDYPNNNGNANCDQPPSRQTVTTTSVMPRMSLADVGGGCASSCGNVKKREKSDEISSSSPSATGSSLAPKRLGSWLAL